MDAVYTIPQIIEGFLWVCGAITATAAACAVVVRMVKAARKPNEDQDKRLSALEDRMAALESGITDKGRDIDRIEAGSRITQRALLALLAHGIDGNSIDAMEQARDELTAYLIDK